MVDRWARIMVVPVHECAGRSLISMVSGRYGRTGTCRGSAPTVVRTVMVSISDTRACVSMRLPATSAGVMGAFGTASIRCAVMTALCIGSQRSSKCSAKESY